MNFLSVSAILLLFPASIFAQTRCDAASGSYDGGSCICEDQNECHALGGVSYPGSPGDYPCPGAPPNVMGCTIHGCAGPDTNSVCQFIDRCQIGTPLPDPVCPGGGDFVCCDYSP